MEIYGFPRFFERFLLGEKGILKGNRLISTGAVVGAGCPATSISGVRPPRGGEGVRPGVRTPPTMGTLDGEFSPAGTP